jgi:hypothetical protein
MREHAAPVAAAARRAGRTFGLGWWWPARWRRSWPSDAGGAGAVARTAGDELDLPLWTLNVFPHGGFHDEVVKTAVYARTGRTKIASPTRGTCAEMGARCCQRGSELPLSTLPLGYRGPGMPGRTCA